MVSGVRGVSVPVVYPSGKFSYANPSATTPKPSPQTEKDPPPAGPDLNTAFGNFQKQAHDRMAEEDSSSSSSSDTSSSDTGSSNAGSSNSDDKPNIPTSKYTPNTSTYHHVASYYYPIIKKNAELNHNTPAFWSQSIPNISNYTMPQPPLLMKMDTSTAWVPPNVSSSLLSPQQLQALSNPFMLNPPSDAISDDQSKSKKKSKSSDGDDWTDSLLGGIMNGYFDGQTPSTNGIQQIAGLQFTSAGLN
jgi:hypothetical protein